MVEQVYASLFSGLSRCHGVLSVNSSEVVLSIELHRMPWGLDGSSSFFLAKQY